MTEFLSKLIIIYKNIYLLWHQACCISLSPCPIMTVKKNKLIDPNNLHKHNVCGTLHSGNSLFYVSDMMLSKVNTHSRERHIQSCSVKFWIKAQPVFYNGKNLRETRTNFFKGTWLTLASTTNTHFYPLTLWNRSLAEPLAQIFVKQSRRFLFYFIYRPKKDSFMMLSLHHDGKRYSATSLTANVP